jgi:alpha-tubulin suppressor-like RCC1 family protein
MPNPITRFKDDGDNVDLGNKLITKDYLMSVYPQIANQLITPELWTWGSGNNGRLGNGAFSGNAITPITTSAGGANWKQISIGADHTAATKTDGTLWTWGSGANGRLGNGDNTDRNTPVPIFGGDNNWASLHSRWVHNAAIKTDGTLWTWGTNDNGTLGDGTTVNKNTPVTVFGSATNWKQASCGGQVTGAIKTDGTLWIWGQSINGYGTLGTDIGNQTALTPITVFGGDQTVWKQISCGGFPVAAIKTDGTLWTWGSNGGAPNQGSLGINSDASGTSGARRTPVPIFGGGNDWKFVDVGGTHMAAIKTDGTLWVWGNNANGQLGVNDVTRRITPVTTFTGGTNWKHISCGGRYTSAIKTDGTLWTWGQGSYGHLGNENTTDRLTPVTTFAGGTNWKQVSSGYFHTVTIKSVNQV